MDLIFLVILIIRDGIFYGIVVHGRPSWFKLVFPFGIYPMFFMFRFCTSYMLVVISIERCIALSNALVYKSRCHSYILLVVFYTSELPNLCNLWWKFQELFAKTFSLVVTSNVPTFFKYEYVHDEYGNVTTFKATSLFQDKTYSQFYRSWQALTNTFLPFVALGSINVKILWNLTKFKQNEAEISQNDGLRIHVGWECKISRIQTTFRWNLLFLGLQGKDKRKGHILSCLLWLLHSWFVMHCNLSLIFSGQLIQ